MAENFVGLQKYVKSEFIDKTYEQAAVVMLKRAIDYEAGAILNKSWKCIKDMVADTPNMNIIQQIIDDAYFAYLQDAKAGNVDAKEQKLVEKQVKFYNAMVEHAYKEAKEEGLVVEDQGIGFKDFHQYNSVSKMTTDFDEEQQLELK